jgi:cell division protein ZipA
MLKKLLLWLELKEKEISMEGYLRLVLLLIVAVIVMLVFYEMHMRRRQLKSILVDPDKVLGLPAREPSLDYRPVTHAISSTRQPEDEWVDDIRVKPVTPVFIPTPAPAPVKVNRPRDLTRDLLVLSVVARPGNQFGSYDLLQAITAAGLQFGDMNIFHYHLRLTPGEAPLFSLASATEPGDFNIDRMGDFSCAGLTLFSNMGDVPDPELAFDLMLKSAQQLADDLDGELRAGMRTPWSGTTLQQYQHRIAEFLTTMGV